VRPCQDIYYNNKGLENKLPEWRGLEVPPDLSVERFQKNPLLLYCPVISANKRHGAGRSSIEESFLRITTARVIRHNPRRMDGGELSRMPVCPTIAEDKEDENRVQHI